MLAVGEDESEEEWELITVGGFDFHIRTAEDDFNQAQKTLFATHIWNGSKTMCTYLQERIGESNISGKSVLELGSGAGLPSLLCTRYVYSENYLNDYFNHDVLVLLMV